MEKLIALSFLSGYNKHMENVRSEIEAFVQRTNEIINSQENTAESKQGAVKEALKQHMEAASTQIPKSNVLSTDDVSSLAQKFSGNSAAAKKADEDAKKEFAEFVEGVGIFNAAKVLEKADPHNMDLLHDYLMGLVNQK